MPTNTHSQQNAIESKRTRSQKWWMKSIKCEQICGLNAMVERELPKVFNSNGIGFRGRGGGWIGRYDRFELFFDDERLRIVKLPRKNCKKNLSGDFGYPEILWNGCEWNWEHSSSNPVPPNRNTCMSRQQINHLSAIKTIRILLIGPTIKQTPLNALDPWITLSTRVYCVTNIRFSPLNVV